MRFTSAAILVFLGGFVIMVLEIVGARFLAKDFGSSFYVWVSQIGVVLAALALGYYVGGALADRRERRGAMAWLLTCGGVLTTLIPDYAPQLLNAIITRHPVNQAISLVWQKLDPALGSALIFLFPCGVLAMLAPYVIRLTAQRVGHVGRISGLVYAFSTLGSLAGVAVSGYLLIDLMKLSNIFRASGALMVLLGGLCRYVERGSSTPGSEAVEE